MIEQYFLPPHQQFDDGFGALADGFRDAAKALAVSKENQHGFGLSFTKLPIYFLNRHAIELFLKGIILILHRRFHPDYPSGGLDSNPTIAVANKQKKLFQIHELALLYDTFKAQIRDNASTIHSSAITDWTTIPPELDDWIATINEADSRSTMFRYPVTTDAQLDAVKSSFKRAAPGAVAAAMNDASTPPQFVLAFKNDDNEIVDTYVHDRDPMSDLAVALDQCVELLSGTHFGLLADLVYRVGLKR